ncbi:pectin lyase fold/virulence factor, partial [Mycena latifolia]
DYFIDNHPRADGDGCPIALTLFRAVRGVIRNFAIKAQPFWCNCIAESQSVIYDGMRCNAINEDPVFASAKCIDTYRSDNASLLNWDITCGDDCFVIKGNSANVLTRNITCRGGNGIALGSLGQYANLTDIVKNVLMEDLKVPSGLDAAAAPQVYFKSWDGSINGRPPTGGGAGPGQNITTRNVVLDRVNQPITITQTNGGHSGYKFADIHFENWTGTALTNEVADLACSAAVNCTDITLEGFNVSVPVGQTPVIVCQNAQGVTGVDCLA